MDRIITDIAAFAASFAYEQLPPVVIEAAKQHLIDSMGCALGGRDGQAAVTGTALAAGGAPSLWPGRIIGNAAPANAATAAFVNGAMIRHLDFNDTIPGGHPSDTLGGILALAPASGADGCRLLGALVVGYEVMARIIAATRLRERGWDQGFAVAIAASAAVGHLLRLEADRIAQAVAIAAVANAPLRVTRSGVLSAWKGAATALACQNGTFGTLLAAQGMRGPDAAFTGRHGVFEQMTGPFTLTPFVQAWLTPRVAFKYWPVENGAQAGVWAARAVRARLAPDAIAAIEIATAAPVWHEIGSGSAKWDPTTRATADHSLPYIFARALVEDGITLAAFDEAAFRDPALRPLMSKISVRADDAITARFPDTVTMRVKATATNGVVHEVEIVDPRGHPDNPMDDAEIAAKFRALAVPALGAARTAEVLAMLGAIEREASLDRLYRVLAGC